MARYREEALTGTKYTRPKAMRLVDNSSTPPIFYFEEEEFTELSDGRRVNSVGDILSIIVTDPLATFNLVNPNTGTVTGQATFRDALIIAYSLYRHAAELRDNPPPPPPPEA